ncbi:MAG: DUF6603 domain-containing protein [Chitinophagaceae bacterium]
MAQDRISDITLIEVAHVLRPLRSLDTPERVLYFLEKIGYKVPAADLVQVLSDVFAKSTEIIALAQELIAAETDEEKRGIVIRFLPVIASSFVEIGKLANAIKAVPGLAQDFIDHAPLNELPRRLVDYLLFLHTYRRYPKIFGTLYLTGVLDDETREANDAIYQPAFSFKKVRWDRLPRYFTEPGEVLNEIYDWNKADKDFNSDLFLKRLEIFLRAMAVPGGIYTQGDNVKNALGNVTDDLPELRIPVYGAGVYPESYAQLGLNISPADKIGDKKKGLALIPYFTGTAQFKFDISEEWESTFSTSLALDAVVGLVIRPPFAMEAFQNIFGDGQRPEDAGSLELGFKTAQKKDANNQVPTIYLFGDKDSTHLSLKDISNTFYAKLNSSRKDFGVELDIKTIELLLDTSEGDAFLSAILPDGGIKASFGLGVGFSLLNGIYFKGSSGIEVLIPVHIKLGPIDIQNVLIGIKPNNGKIPVDIGASVKGTLGPLVVVVENIGLTSTISFPENGQGNVGPLDIDLAFKPPKGVGLSIDAGIVKGGGYLFLDYEKGLYAGAMMLSVQGFLTLNAIGLVSTKMPDGSPGFSMLVIVTAEFMPAFQLGFGFTLIGVGGLLGLNRTVLLDPLRDGVREGTINDILFPTNVIENAPRIISDLQEIFPPQQGSFLVGPMAKIGWGTPTLISLSLGVIIQLPDPLIAILGVLKMTLPTEQTPLLKIQVNFLGTIDPSEKLITFDASLYDSHLVYVMTLEGDMIVRLKYGNQPDFILAVGGFHPDYHPTMVVPDMNRISISLLDHDNARLRIESYFALTSNTAQFGARVLAYFGVDGFNVTGDVGFDALIQFSPFQFVAHLWGIFALNTPLGDAEMSVTALLRGPRPWYVNAIGSIEVFGFDWELEVTVEWGEDDQEALEEIAIRDKFIQEMAKAEVYHTDLPAGRQNLIALVSPEAYEDNPPASAPPNTTPKEQLSRIHPFGSLMITQKMIPLNFEMDKFGNQVISDVHHVSIQTVAIGSQTASLTTTRDFFAVAQYKEMSDAEKLSRPSFEEFNNGVKAVFTQDGSEFVVGGAVRQNLEYEQIYIDRDIVQQPMKKLLTGKMYTDLLKGSASKKSKLSMRYKNRLRKTDGVDTESKISYTIGNTTDNKPLHTGMDFKTMTEANDAMQELIKNNHALKGNIVLIEQI